MPEQQNIEYKQSWHDEYLKWVCGLANAAIIKAMLNRRNKNGKCRNIVFQELKPAKLFADETLMPAWLPAFLFTYQTIIIGTNKPSKKNCGAAKLILFK